MNNLLMRMGRPAYLKTIAARRTIAQPLSNLPTNQWMAHRVNLRKNPALLFFADY